MGGADLAGLLELLLLGSGCRGSVTACTRAIARVVLGHVQLELFGVGVCGRFPSRGLVDKVEVVGEVLAVAVADLPVGRQAGLFLLQEQGRLDILSIALWLQPIAALVSTYAVLARHNCGCLFVLDGGRCDDRDVVIQEKSYRLRRTKVMRFQKEYRKRGKVIEFAIGGIWRHLLQMLRNLSTQKVQLRSYLFARSSPQCKQLRWRRRLPQRQAEKCERGGAAS